MPASPTMMAKPFNWPASSTISSIESTSPAKASCLRHVKKIHQTHLSPPEMIICKYQHCTLLIKPLKDGYYLVLTLAHARHLSNAIRCLEDTARVLQLDM